MRPRTIVIGLVLAAGLLLVLRTGAVPLLDPDEARFARTSVEMLRAGDPVVPSFEGQPRLVKPPLMHWIQSFFFSLFGVSEPVARLHAVLATLGSLLLIGAVAGRRFGAEARAWAIAVMGTMPLVVALGRIGTLDALLAVHVLAVWALDLVVPDRTPSPYRGAAFGALLGLAFLVKGPVGVALPLLMILAGRTLAGRDVLPSMRSAALALAAGVAVVLPWGLAFVSRVEWSTALGTLRHEGIERFFRSDVHAQPFWFYLPVLVVGWMPWIGPLAVGLWRTVLLRNDPAARTALYASAGLVTGTLFFSLAASRLPNYILPLAPLAALIVVWQLGQELEDPRRLGGSLSLAVASGAFAIVLVAASFRLDEPAYVMAARGGAVLFLGGCGVAIAGLLRRNPRLSYGGAAATSFLFLALVMTVVLPVVGRQRSAASLVEAVPELREGQLVFVVDMKLPSLTFYMDAIPEPVDMANLEERISVAGRGLLVFDKRDLPAAPESVRQRLQPVGEQGKYRVFSLSPTLRTPDPG